MEILDEEILALAISLQNGRAISHQKTTSARCVPYQESIPEKESLGSILTDDASAKFNHVPGPPEPEDMRGY